LTATGDFQGGRLTDFTPSGSDTYTAVIAPEWRPMNNQQAWYAFQITSRDKKTIQVELTYTDNKEQLFAPKISHDRATWTPLEAGKVRSLEGGKRTVLTLEVGPEPLWVSAQELFTESDFDRWIDKVAQHPFVKVSQIGFSALGRPIRKLDISEAPAGAPLVLVLGRQHPPEVTGTLGLTAFVETLAGDSDLARQFRRQFHILVVPLANPDGVNAGHWRYNVKGVDLNRDWGTFEQKETAVIRDEILRAKNTAKGQFPFFIDYHSTTKDVYYPSPAVKSKLPDDKVGPSDRFMRRWLARAMELQGHTVPVEVSPATREKKLNATTWMRQWNAASVTREFAHVTDRSSIRKSGECEAQALMELLTTDTDNQKGE
jgi:hypothetical protein